MKKTALNIIPCELPRELKCYIGAARVYNSSSSPDAAVYYIEKDGGFYLKLARKGALAKEHAMTKYFHSKGIGAEVISYISDDADYMLTVSVKGEDCVFEAYLSEPKRLCDTVASELRKLHEISPEGCPVVNRTAEYLAYADMNYKSGNYDKTNFPDSFGYRSADDAYVALNDGRALLKSNVLIHGDYCLPNIILDNWKFSGFIDVGNGGVGDRHIDLFWGIWSLAFNLKTDKYRERFLDAYGRDKADESILRVVAAAEVFG